MANGLYEPECAVAIGQSGQSGTSPQEGAQSVSNFHASFEAGHQSNMLALIGGARWTGNSVTYSFPDQTSDYSSSASSYGNGELTSGFGALNYAQTQAADRAFDLISDYTGLSISEITGNQGSADIRLARSNMPSTAWAYYPASFSEGGDAWFNGSNGYYNNPTIGTYANHTFLHEIGHSFGLKHGHDASGYGKLSGIYDSMEYSVMTYKSHAGSSGSGYTNEYYGYAQTYMAYDIAALQALYGVNWNYRSGDTTYTFSSSTGEMAVNGTGIGAPASNRIFRTIWDGGGEDTIDLSNYSPNDITADLSSGGQISFSSIQTAQLAGGVYASANLYLALAPNNRADAMIENIITGKGADRIDGNKTSNTIKAAGGWDTVYGHGGDDFIFGGGGRDKIIGGADDDWIHGGLGRDWLKGGGGADTFLLTHRSSKDVIVDFMIGTDIIDVPDTTLATLMVSNTGHLTVEYLGSQAILRHLDWGDATLEDLVI